MAHGSQHTGTIMENQTRFNLTDAIEEWRRSLEETPSTMTEREEQLRLQIHQCLDQTRQTYARPTAPNSPHSVG